MSQTKAQLLDGKSATIQFTGGSASVPAVSFTGDTNTGLYSPGADQIAVATGGTARLYIDASGRVGIGTSTPGSYSSSANRLVVSGSSDTGITIAAGSSSYSAVYFADGTTGGETYRGIVGYNHTFDRLEFFTAELLRSTIDSSGRLLVGTSSSSASARAVFQGNSFAGSQPGIIYIQRDTSSTGLTAGNAMGYIIFADNAGANYAVIGCEADGSTGTNDYPSRLTFSTCADGASSPTERMRIDNNGDIGLSTTSDGLFGKDPRLAVAKTVAAGRCVVQINAAGSVGNTDRNALECIDDGGEKLFIRQNGNVVNLNNSYGAISDAKLKENVVDASSQWADIKALKVRNYNFKSDLSRRQIGVVAQELELVSPGIVTDSPDYDAEGNDLGTVTKSVNYSVLYMKAVKALQEAMERIETLEAKVAALESA